MKKYFSMNHLPWTLIVLGLGMNLIEIATTPSTSGTTSGGRLFGSSGYLKSINNTLPAVKLPGMSTPLNLGGWMVVVGVVWLLVRRFV